LKKFSFLVTGRLDELFDHTGLLAEELNWMEAGHRVADAESELMLERMCYFCPVRGMVVPHL